MKPRIEEMPVLWIQITLILGIRIQRSARSSFPFPTAGVDNQKGEGELPR